MDTFLKHTNGLKKNPQSLALYLWQMPIKQLIIVPSNKNVRFDFQFSFALESNWSIRIGKEINSDFPFSPDLLPRSLKFKQFFFCLSKW